MVNIYYKMHEETSIKNWRPRGCPGARLYKSLEKIRLVLQVRNCSHYYYFLE